MGVLSKTNEVSTQLVASYLLQLYQHPIRTKSLTATTLATLGNLTAQCLRGGPIDTTSLRAFALFGLLFGGTVPHYFHEALRRLVPSTARLAPLRMLLIERLIFTPIYQYFSLYTLARLEGKSHNQAKSGALRVYFPVIEANYRYLTLIQFINLYYVPPMFRVLVTNLVAFFWVIFLQKKRGAAQKKSNPKGQ